MPDPTHLIDWHRLPVGIACGSGDSGTPDVTDVDCFDCLAQVLSDYGYVRTGEQSWAFPGEQSRVPTSITRLDDGRYRFTVEYPGRPWSGDFDTLAEAVDDAGEM